MPRALYPSPAVRAPVFESLSASASRILIKFAPEFSSRYRIPGYLVESSYSAGVVMIDKDKEYAAISAEPK
jgi:hypothetical protein